MTPLARVAAVGIALVGAVSPSHGGDRFIDDNGVEPKGKSGSQSIAVNGQKDDLELSVETELVGRSCDGLPCTEVTGAKVTVKVKWKVMTGAVNGVQSNWVQIDWAGERGAVGNDWLYEGSDGPDALLVTWGEEWRFVNASDDPSDSGPQYVLWANEINCPESPFALTGSSGGFFFTRTIELRVQQPGTPCAPSLNVDLKYLHTYDGDFVFSGEGSAGIGLTATASGPEISISPGSVSYTNNHAWQKPLNQSFALPAQHVTACSCCTVGAPADGGSAPPERCERPDCEPCCERTTGSRPDYDACVRACQR